jgi:hypothetical protein
MADMLQVILPRGFLSQMLDGLEYLIEEWQATAEFLETGYMPDDSMGVRDCSGPEEALKIAQYYTRIRDQLAAQL